MKRIMVDMSATIIHHGHIRLLKQASTLGEVVVGLTSDDEIIEQKGYLPEISYDFRKEILESIKYVKEVVSTPWHIDEKIISQYKIDYLVHGNDNSNSITEGKLKLFPRTPGISSSEIRQRAQLALTSISNQKLMLTPGPAVVLHDNIKNLKPIFGRGDAEYDEMSNSVIEWIKDLAGQDEVITAQGSATFALELAAHTFVRGKVLLISTGYYSDRLQKLLPSECEVTVCKYKDIDSVDGKFDWVLCAYTETSIAFKIDLQKVKDLANKSGSKLYVDATGSIGLEDGHELADLMAFSSCKGLFGLTGACFVAFKKNLHEEKSEHFYFNLKTQKNKMVTGPYHAIASLFGVMRNHDKYKQRVIKSKEITLKKWSHLVRKSNQPLLCTYLEGEVIKNDPNIVLYSPRSDLDGSVICHFGEIHSSEIKINNRIKFKPC
jgi:cytidyltransferase-like protein